MDSTADTGSVARSTFGPILPETRSSLNIPQCVAFDIIWSLLTLAKHLSEPCVFFIQHTLGCSSANQQEGEAWGSMHQDLQIFSLNVGLLEQWGRETDSQVLHDRVWQSFISYQALHCKIQECERFLEIHADEFREMIMAGQNSGKIHFVSFFLRKLSPTHSEHLSSLWCWRLGFIHFSH